MQKLQIEKFLVVSTSHLTPEEGFTLANCREPFYVIDYEEGYVVFLDQETPNKSDIFSESFKKLFLFAKNHEEGFTHLKFDRDGDVLEGFETFDW